MKESQLSSLVRVSDYKGLLQKVSPKELYAACPNPFLVGHSILDTSTSHHKDKARRTVVVEPDDSQQVKEAISWIDRVWRIKRTQVVPENRVTLGGVPENDITLAGLSISSQHCAFHCPDGKTLLVEDLNSLNGTLIDGELIPKGERRAIEDGQILTVGLFQLRYYTPKGFIQFLMKKPNQ